MAGRAYPSAQRTQRVPDRRHSITSAADGCIVSESHPTRRSSPGLRRQRNARWLSYRTHGVGWRSGCSGTATSRDLKSASRHRWFYFPHSYSYRLVNTILDYWQFTSDDTLVDNFAGSGTTLLAARERGLSVLGFDLSPLAVTSTNAKVAPYRERLLARALRRILEAAPVASRRTSTDGLIGSRQPDGQWMAATSVRHNSQ